VNWVIYDRVILFNVVGCVCYLLSNVVLNTDHFGLSPKCD